MRLDVILRIAGKLLIPFMLVFAFYVHFHGDFGPGGGFQAGVIIAGAVVLYGVIFGHYAVRRVLPQRVAEAMIPLGVVIFASAGLPALYYGDNYLNYSVLAHHADHGQHLGVLWVETGVIVTVAGSMISIFYALVERGR